MCDQRSSQSCTSISPNFWSILRKAGYGGLLAGWSGLGALADEFIPVGDVVAEIKSEIAAAQAADPAAPKLILERVEVEISTSISSSTDGQLSLTVPIVAITIGGSAEVKSSSTRTQRLSFSLLPSSDVKISGTSELGLASVIRSLKAAIRNSINTPPDLDMPKFKYEADFVLGKSADGKLGFWIVSAGKEYEQSSTNHIVFYLAREQL
jgi:hypothetical protein